MKDTITALLGLIAGFAVFIAAIAFIQSFFLGTIFRGF
jgi:hypothetical protein